MIPHTTETSHLIYARVAGFAFFFYIVAGMTSLALANQSPVTGMLTLLMNFSALVLGVTLYMITREQGARARNACPDLSCARSRLWRGYSFLRCW